VAPGAAPQPRLDERRGFAGRKHAHAENALLLAQHRHHALDARLGFLGAGRRRNLDRERAGEAVAPAHDDAVQEDGAGERDRGEERHHRDDPGQRARGRIAIERDVGRMPQ
jgi:hypothetical protein